MTLIIGIKCSDGFVIGADGAATYAASGGTMTIRQAFKKKIRMVSNQGIVATSGAVGIAQRIWGQICDVQHSSKIFIAGSPTKPASEKPLAQAKTHEVMAYLRQIIWETIGRELDIARSAAQSIGAQAYSAASSSTIVCLMAGGKPCMIQFDQQGSPEEVNEDLPFVAIGSGQIIADPFLAFLRRIYWPHALPDIQEGIFTAAWALNHTIQTNPGGVGFPLQIITFKQIEETDAKGIKSKNWRTEEVPEAAWQEHLQASEGIEKMMASHRIEQRTAGIPPIPRPPA